MTKERLPLFGKAAKAAEVSNVNPDPGTYAVQALTGKRGKTKAGEDRYSIRLYVLQGFNDGEFFETEQAGRTIFASYGLGSVPGTTALLRDLKVLGVPFDENGFDPSDIPGKYALVDVVKNGDFLNTRNLRPLPKDWTAPELVEEPVPAGTAAGDAEPDDDIPF